MHYRRTLLILAGLTAIAAVACSSAVETAVGGRPAAASKTQDASPSERPQTANPESTATSEPK